MKIFCKNYQCKNSRFLDDFINFSFRKNYIPLGKEDGLCMAECKKEFCGFDALGIASNNINYSVAQCSVDKNNKCFKECLWNNNHICEREEIFIDKITVDNIDYWICKCQSDIKIKGHRDWSQLLQPDKTAKGGHISDRDADKENKNNKVSKAFPDHFRQKL